MNEHVEREILSYIKRPITQYAMMMTSDWGTGKTYYINNKMKKYVEKNGLTVIYVSLFNINSINQLYKEIYLKSVLKGKSSASNASAIGKTIINSFGKTVIKNLNIEIDELPYKHMINFGKILIILDDLERTSINIIDIFGHVSEMVEDYFAKVLLVCNENEIDKREDEETKYIKYNMFLSNFDSLEGYETEKEKSVDYYINRANKERTNKVKFNHDNLEYAVKSFFKDSSSYNTYKEKVVQRTIEFESNIDVMFDEVANAHITYLKELAFIRRFKESIIYSFKKNKSSNYRTLKYVFDLCIDLLYGIDEKIYDENEYFVDVMKSYIHMICRLSIEHRDNKRNISDYITREREESYYENGVMVTIDANIVIYILNSKIDENIIKDKFNSEYISKSNSLLLELKELNNGLLIESDKKYLDVVNQVFEKLSVDSVEYDLYLQIVQRVYLMDELSSDFSRTKEFIEVMSNNLKNTKKLPELSRFNNYSAIGVNEIKNLVENLIDLFSESKSRVLMERINDALIGDDWSESFYNYYIKEYAKYIYDEKVFLGYVDIERLISLISTSSSNNIYQLRQVLSDVYKSSNIGEFLLRDLESLKKLLTGINKMDNSSFSISMKQNMKYLCNDIAGFISKIEVYET